MGLKEGGRPPDERFRGCRDAGSTGASADDARETRNRPDAFVKAACQRSRWPRRADQRHPPYRGPAAARGWTQRPAFHTSPHFLHRMYVSSGAVLALNTGSTAPQLGQACEGGVVELLTNSSNRLRKGDQPSEAKAPGDDPRRAKRWPREAQEPVAIHRRAKRWRAPREAHGPRKAAGIDPKREVRRTGALGLITPATPIRPPRRAIGGGGGN